MSFCLTSGSDDKETFAGAKVQQIFDICKSIYKKNIRTRIKLREKNEEYYRKNACE